MKNRLFILVFAFLALIFTTASNPVAPSATPTYVLVIHGGAGNFTEASIPAERATAYRQKMQEALDKGEEVLKNNGTAVEAVEEVIRIMEDSPLFNAGKGAVFTHEGYNELDASIMDGSTLNAGAVAGVRTVKNPVSAARAVMQQSPHVLLAGRGAEAFAQQQGLEMVDTAYFFTQRRWDLLQRTIRYEDEQQGNDGESSKGTVGCVALDQHGNLAAGTSTGGMNNKRYGRIGDSPVIGAGTYADNSTCAVSCTGHGEFFIRYAVAYDMSALMAYKNLSVEDAARLVIHKKLKEISANGGLIAVDKSGSFTMQFNTSGMFRGYVTSGGESDILFYK